MAGKVEEKKLEECTVSNDSRNELMTVRIGNLKSLWMMIILCALGTWIFSVAGALIAIPVGIKRKSLAPLVFFGTTGTMLDIIMGIDACEREHAERQMKLLEAQNAAAVDATAQS
ncbi:hypothetical protein SASPL_100833 [Salvia splendens]|uniref:Transmembrane protein n=1 Tax=Salvia splendens TaxID=180675 RepID=A0A8X8YSW7_SALSN|nr:hypothetical protein SASPL_100833 [Salvia splendens]